MTRFAGRVSVLAALLLARVMPALGAAAEDIAALRSEVLALSQLTAPPAIHAVEGFPAAEGVRAIYYDALPWQGKPTRVFAWLGVPAGGGEKKPAIVLVQGGGGTAFKEWVRKWNDQGFVAISIAVEGQTDERIPDASRGALQWRRHAWGGPARDGIFADSDRPLADQWMYHAVADTILAHSLLRALPGVDAARIGLMGISWGGVITSTVIGIDPRFAFAIPTYGCGHLADADNQWGRALGANRIYREVWDPMVRMERVRGPVLWLSWPGDLHFPLDCQAATYASAPGPRMVALIPDMKHSHPAGWNPPDSYAFAASVVRHGKPWLRTVAQENSARAIRVEFESAKPLDSGVLVTSSDTGFTGTRTWTTTPARLEARPGGRWVVTGSLPPGTRAWFANVRSGSLTASSDFHSLSAPVGATVTSPAALTGFTWDRVPLYTHFAKRTTDLTPSELDFLARHAPIVALEKGHGAAIHGTTEAGIAATARELKRRNPRMKVLFYFNAFINWQPYAAFARYQPEWTLRDANGQVVSHPAGAARPDPSQPAMREWWSDTVAAALRDAPLDGVFADALPQALSPALARQLGADKARAVVAGLREMLALTKRKLGPDRIILVNGTRTHEFRALLDWEGIDGVMIEHFGGFKTDHPADLKADLETLALAAGKGKFAVVKGWPGFNWLDKEMMARPYAELLALARERITFPLACFLVAAQPGSYFCYSWGYTHEHGMLDAYAEFARPLGPPRGEARWDGLAATREFERASVRVDLAAKSAQIEWRNP